MALSLLTTCYHQYVYEGIEYHSHNLYTIKTEIKYNYVEQELQNVLGKSGDQKKQCIFGINTTQVMATDFTPRSMYVLYQL